MANKLYREGNFVVLEQGTRIVNFPVIDSDYEYNENTQVYSIKSYQSRKTGVINRSDIGTYTNEISVAYTEASLNSFLRQNTGLTNELVSISATGWASYVDTMYTSVSPFSVSAGVTVALPNNAGTIIDNQKPDDITSFYQSGKITGRNGDNLNAMFYFWAIPSATNAELDIWVDIGGSIGAIYVQTIYFRGTSPKGVLYSLPSAYTGATWETNGGTIYIKPSVNMQFYGMTYNFDRSHKARVII